VLLVGGCRSGPPKSTSTSTVIAGSSVAPTASASPIPVGTTGGELRYTVHVGDVVRLLLPAGTEVSEVGTREVADLGGGVYKAVGVGTASLEVVRRPSCAPAAQCSQLIQLLQVVEITVKAK
jgi:hypothetical protein